jgi:stage II sporulation protein R
LNTLGKYDNTQITEDFTMKNILKRHGLDLAMLIGAAAAIAVAGFASFVLECERIPDGVLRLHIVAESDSEQDQQLKYQIRDHILESFAGQLQDSDSLEESVEKSRELLPQIESAARRLAEREDITAEITEMYFTTRKYDTGTLPAGTYTALRITIGDGNGGNWWCVMFPALCLPAVSEPRTVSVINLPDSVTDSPRIKFALFEFLNSFFK